MEVSAAKLRHRNKFLWSIEFSAKLPKKLSGKRIVFSADDTGVIMYLYAKRYIQILPDAIHTKMAQNGS